MYLLKQAKLTGRSFDKNTFTFHHVSIKTQIVNIDYYLFIHSHSTMYLLKPHHLHYRLYRLYHSHSTMYLLKRDKRQVRQPHKRFTFHHVSIKTKKAICVDLQGWYSHSTMYLLKLYTQTGSLQIYSIHIPPCIY